MESKYIQGIERKINELAREYKNKGYKVLIEPKRNLIPEFLGDFQPDLVALSDEDNVVIEVKSSDSKRDFKMLEALATIVDSKENWRFELVFTNPKDKQNNENDLNVIDTKKIEIRLNECKSLLNSGNIDSAFLIGWSTLEASIRIRLKSSNLKEVDVQKPTLYLMKNLFSFGIINQTVLRKLEVLNQYRNKLVHGFETNLNNENVSSLIEIIELLLEKGNNSDVYKWVESLDLEGYEEIYCLYRSIEVLDEYGLFTTRKKGGKIFVKSSLLDEELQLNSEKQKQEMLKFIEDEYMNGMDSEGFYGFNRAMEKDD